MPANTITKRIDTEIKLICYVKDGRKGKSEKIRRKREKKKVEGWVKVVDGELIKENKEGG